MYQTGANAYQQTTKAVETPREREAALLMRAAASLQKLRDEWPANSEHLETAINFNCKLWTVFMTSVTKDDNPLPTEVRQNIANLGLFVMNQSREMLLEPEQEKLAVLVNLNRQIAAGLRGM